MVQDLPSRTTRSGHSYRPVIHSRSRLGSPAALARAYLISCLVAAGGLTTATPSAAQAVNTCLAETGIALIGGHSAATVRDGSGMTSISWLFGGPGGGAVYCGPEFGGAATLGAAGNAGHVSYAGGTGLVFTTIGLASPGYSGQGQGYTKTTMIFKFRVIPDDPQSTTPVTVDFVMRHRFFGVDNQITGPASAYNNYIGAYGVSSSPGGLGTSFPGTAGEWSTGLFAPLENMVRDHYVSEDVQPNLDRYFNAYVEQTSSANGSVFPVASSAMGIASQWSFEATTDAAATIVFDYEELLDLDPPTLDSVPEPGLATGLSVAILLAACLAANRDPRSCPNHA